MVKILESFPNSYRYLVYNVYYHDYKDSTRNGAKGTDWYNELCHVNQKQMLNLS